MSGREPKSTNLLEPGATTALAWEAVRALLTDARLYWLATVHPAGHPHVRPVLAVWLDGALYSTSAASSRQSRNLAADPRCTVTARTDSMHVVLEGNATQVTSEETLQRIAAAYRSKYDWPVTVTGGAFDAPYGAPVAGPPPYHLYEIAPAVVFGFGTVEEYAGRATRWSF
jgi:hypothetical protein